MLNLTPAYGRDYKSKKAVQADLDSGKDFIINDISNRWNGSYINKADIGSECYVRYDGLKKKALFKIN